MSTITNDVASSVQGHRRKFERVVKNIEAILGMPGFCLWPGGDECRREMCRLMRKAWELSTLYYGCQNKYNKLSVDTITISGS